MPALPSVPGVLRIDTYFRLAEDLQAKTRAFWKYLSGPPTESELTAMAVAVNVAFGADLKSLMFHVYELIQVTITDLSSPTGAVGGDATVVAGTNTGAALTADACLLESLHIGRRYRGGHPRIYWPFGTGDDLADNQTWGSTFLGNATTGFTNYDTAVDAAVNAWGTNGGQCAVSFYEGFTVHTGTTGRARNVSTPRSSAVVDDVVSRQLRQGVAVQRRRNLHLA